MTLETEKKLNDETTRFKDAAWERELERRLASDLDAFLATVGDDAFFFPDEEKTDDGKARPTANATKQASKRRRFLGLATSVAASALLGVVGWSTFVYIESPKKETSVKTTASAGVVGDNTSLVAWSVEKWGETEQATLCRLVGERWLKVGVLKNRDETTGDSNGEENLLPLVSETGDAAGETERIDKEKENAGIDVIAWNDALSDEGIALTLWTYDPLWRVAALLR